MPVFSYREAQFEDAKKIARVHVETRHKAYSSFADHDVLKQDTVEKRTTQWRSILKDMADEDRFLHLALADDEIVGFTNAGPARDDEMPYAGELYALYVLPAYWQQGIGYQLFRKSIVNLKKSGMDSMYLWVFKENKTGRGFYDRVAGKIQPGMNKQVALGGQTYEEIVYAWDTL